MNNQLERIELPNSVEYRLDGKLHREEGPAVEWACGGKEWWVDGNRHRLDGPAVEWSNGGKEWWVDGKRHRLDGPAMEWACGGKEWYIDGILHRLDGPAVEWADGGKEWFVDDKLHREDGPAIERADGSKEWYVDDKLHRMDGPAIEYANGDKEWWVLGVSYSRKQFMQRIATMVDTEEGSSTIAPLPIKITHANINVSLFFESSQTKLENTVPRTSLTDDEFAKVKQYNLDPVVYLDKRIIAELLQFYESSVQKCVSDKNKTFRQLIYTEKHVAFLKSDLAYEPRFTDAQLLISQWVAWLYQHTLKEVSLLTQKLRENITKIRNYLPGVYKPELYADLFEDFFLNGKPIIDIEKADKYRELNFVLHEKDGNVFENSMVYKMLSGLRNFNLFHEWIDARLAENDESSLNNAKDKCKLGKAGEGWMCGDGMFDSIPSLLSESESGIGWEKKPEKDDEVAVNFQKIAKVLLAKSNKTKADFPDGFNGTPFIKFVKDLMWSNKTFRTRFGYNDKEKFEGMFNPEDGFMRNYYNTDVVEYIFDFLSA